MNILVKFDSYKKEKRESLFLWQQTKWLFIPWAHKHKTQHWRNVLFPQLSSVEAGGSTAFIYANFSVPVVEVNTLLKSQRSLTQPLFVFVSFSCLKLDYFHLPHILCRSCQNAKRSDHNNNTWDSLPQYCYCIFEPPPGLPRGLTFHLSCYWALTSCLFIQKITGLNKPIK